MTRTRDAVASGIAWGSIARIVQVAAQFAATAALARLLAPTDFGVVSMAAVFLAMANALADFGVRSYVIHRPSLDQTEIETAKAVSLILGFGVFTAAALAAWPLAWFFREPRLAPVVVVQALVYIVTSAGAVPSALLIRRLGFRRMALSEVAASLTYVTTAVVLAGAGVGYWSLVLGRVASSLAGLLVVAHRAGSMMPRSPSVERMGSMARFGGAVTGTGILTQVDENFDNIVVGRFLGAELLGVYAVGYNVAALPQRYLAYLVAGVANPVVARAEPAALSAAIQKYARYQVLGPGAVAVGLSIMAPEVTEILLGSRWAEAAPLIRLMGLSTAMLALGTVIGGSLVSRGAVKPLFAFHAAKLAATVLGVLAGLRFGMVGVAGGFLVATSASVLLGLRHVEARLRVSGVLRACFGPGAVVAAAALAAWASRSIALAADAAPYVVLAGAGFTFVAVLAGAAVIAFEDVRRDLRGVRLPRFVGRLAGRSGP